MRRTPFYNFFIVALLVTMTASVSAQQVDSKLPWSVRLTESEMIRYPESWQLDFQPKLKWDYCHGLELGAMLDVYDAYGDKKIRDYAIAYADTMVLCFRPRAPLYPITPSRMRIQWCTRTEALPLIN